jgi:hypothetical protein
MLFPIANLFVNSYTFTAVEALIQKRLFSAVEGTVGTAAGAVTHQGRRLLGSGAAGALSDPQGDEAEMWTGPSLPGRAYRATRRTGAELLSIPASIAFSLAVTPVEYLYAQGRGLSRRPVSHVMDTLAQLPGVEVLVDAASFGRPAAQRWGRGGKGLFSAGALNESAGRLSSPGWFIDPNPSRIEAQALLDSPVAGDGCGLPRCQGVLYVDISDLAGRGLFGDLRRPWLNYTLGWFDLVGAHSSYREPQLAPLIVRLLPARAAVPGPEGTGPAGAPRSPAGVGDGPADRSLDGAAPDRAAPAALAPPRARKRSWTGVPPAGR